jgi:hypothetical protein
LHNFEAGARVGHNDDMQTEVYLEPVPDADISIGRCSICKEEFHSSPLGPRRWMRDFRKHIEEEHPDAVYAPNRTRLLYEK